MTATDAPPHDLPGGSGSPAPSAPPTPMRGVAPARQRNREMLSICVIVLALSAVLQVRSDGRVFFQGLASHPLPESCMSRSVFGVKCPGCGLTRSFISLAHGHWNQSLAYHRLGWLLFAAAALQVPYRLARLYRRAASEKPLKGIGPWVGWTLVGLLIGNWCLEMLLGHTS